MIYCIALGDKNVASSRLRVHLIAPYLSYSFNLPERYEKGDVLIIQKVHNPNELQKARTQGAKIIFDIDDYYWYRRAYASMVEMADIVTTDTEEKKKEIEKLNKRVEVIPDALDWGGKTRMEELKNGVAGWIGYGNNARFLEGIDLPYTLRLITTQDARNYFSGDFSLVEWNIETADEEIRKCEIMINHLPLNETTKLKGMHKLLKSWANGVPCYTSRIPDYMKAMREAGVGEKYLVNNWSNLKNIGFDSVCRDYALQYSCDKISILWKNTIEKL